MQATAIAQPNIALVKYWGKRDLARNLPAVGSISVTLSGLQTEMTVRLNDAGHRDRLIVNGASAEKMLPRVSATLDRVIGEKREFAVVESRSNFPIAAGLASSASAFAALTMAAAAAAGRSLSQQELSRLAAESSGSAARSLYGGFVELRNGADEIHVSQLAAENDWPLSIIVAVTEAGPKAVGSTEAMEISRKTSPFYGNWLAHQDGDLDIARGAIEARDFAALASIAEHSCLKMHSVMWASRPPLVYWNPATLSCMQTVRDLQNSGADVFFTIDAGPQLKAICSPDDSDIVHDALRSTSGVIDVLRSALGGAARLVVDE